jgi:hypothetical protein
MKPVELTWGRLLQFHLRGNDRTRELMSILAMQRVGGVYDLMLCPPGPELR